MAADRSKPWNERGYLVGTSPSKAAIYSNHILEPEKGKYRDCLEYVDVTGLKAVPCPCGIVRYIQ